MKNWLYACLLGTGMLLCSHFTAASCQFSTDSGYISSMKTYAMPVSINISVPAGTPTGQEIYRQRINLLSQGNVKIECTSAGQFYRAFKYSSTPLSAATWSSTVYQTGVAGIGIQFGTSQDGGGIFPYTGASTVCTSTKTNCSYESGWSTNSWFSLIKISDDVTPGDISGTKLPTVTYSFGQSGYMVNVFKVSLSGTIKVRVPTCDVSLASSAMTVNMGEYETSVFTAKGNATAWKDASIRLANCGYFYGNSYGANVMATFNGSTTTYSALKSNNLALTLTPRNGIADANNGIMNIDENPLKATGIGIQLSTSESESGKIDLNSPVIQALPQNGSSTITVPLYARYIQTENSIQAGKANGRLEYVITYQ